MSIPGLARTAQTFRHQSFQDPTPTRFSQLFCCAYIHKIFTVFWNALQRCIARGPLFNLRTFGELTSYDREHRIRKGAVDIHSRLSRELQHAQNQMAKENDKAFVFLEAPADFPAVHEERIGNYQVGICHLQGHRPTMEDEHIAIAFNLSIAGRNYPVTLFGIFDGHGGRTAAQYVKDHLQEQLSQALIEFNPHGLSEKGIWNGLKMSCVRLSEAFYAEYSVRNISTEGWGLPRAYGEGTTATIAMILDDRLWTANVGDSRIVLNRNGTAYQLTYDAKAEDDRYRRGIEHRGGTIAFNGVWRINGDLACARSIGDYRLRGANSARPKITSVPLSWLEPRSDLLIGCDGNFDVGSSRQFALAAHNHPLQSPGHLARNLVYSAYSAGSTDNISLLVVRLRP